MYSKGREDRILVYISRSTKEAAKMLRKITNWYLRLRDSKIDDIFEECVKKIQKKDFSLILYLFISFSSLFLYFFNE